MSETDYVRARSLAHACELLAGGGPGAIPLAGGTDVLVDTRIGRSRPTLLVDLGEVEELRGITVAGDDLRIGAGTTIDAVSRSHLVREWAPPLEEAALDFGSPQVRNQATIGGNIVTASPAADCVPSLLALDARVRLVGLAGERIVPLAAFLQGPRRVDRRPDEVLAEVRIARLPEGTRGAAVKVGLRRALAIAIVGVAVVVPPGGPPRIALGSVAPTVIRARQAEAIAREGGPAAVRDAALAAARECSPIDDLRASASYRRRLVSVWTERALRRAYGVESESASA